MTVLNVFYVVCAVCFVLMFVLGTSPSKFNRTLSIGLGMVGWVDVVALLTYNKHLVHVISYLLSKCSGVNI